MNLFRVGRFRPEPALGQFLAWMAGAALTLSASAEELTRYSFERAAMGVPFRLTFYATDQALAQSASDAAFDHVATLNSILSDYEPESELSRLSRTAGSGKTIPVSQALWQVLESSQKLAEQSGGAFDITIGPIVDVWRRARRQRALPGERVLGIARHRAGFRHLELLPSEKSVRLLRSSMRLDLGGIAKGYVAGEAVAFLRARGISRALAAASGDIVAGDPPPGTRGWRIALATLASPHPEQPAVSGQVLALANAAVSTSGDTYQYVEIEGVRYSHIIDPRTGDAIRERRLVTVVAPDGVTADGLDTAASVLGISAGLELIENTPGASARFQHIVEGEVSTSHTSRWPTLPWE